MNLLVARLTIVLQADLLTSMPHYTKKFNLFLAV